MDENVLFMGTHKWHQKVSKSHSWLELGFLPHCKVDLASQAVSLAETQCSHRQSAIIAILLNCTLPVIGTACACHMLIFGLCLRKYQVGQYYVEHHDMNEAKACHELQVTNQHGSNNILIMILSNYGTNPGKIEEQGQTTAACK